LILSGDSLLASNLSLTVYASKELEVLVFMQYICETIISTLAEECGEMVILALKYNKGKIKHFHLKSPLRSKILKTPDILKKNPERH